MYGRTCGNVNVAGRSPDDTGRLEVLVPVVGVARDASVQSAHRGVTRRHIGRLHQASCTTNNKLLLSTVSSIDIDHWALYDTLLFLEGNIKAAVECPSRRAEED